MRLIKDSSGVPSWSFTLGIPVLIAITTWFILGGIKIAVGTFQLTFSTKEGLEYAAAITPWLAYLRSRDWVPSLPSTPERKDEEKCSDSPHL